MKLYTDRISQFIIDTNYTIIKFYENENVNIFMNYFNLLDKNESILLKDTSIELNTLLYTKYYFFAKFKKEFSKYYAHDEGVEQQMFKIVEEIDQKLEEGVDWSVIKSIEDLITD